MSATVSPNAICDLILKVNPGATTILQRSQGDLFEYGALDSYSMVQLIQCLEEYFDIIFDYSDLRARHFESVDAIMKLLTRKYGCAQDAVSISGK